MKVYSNNISVPSLLKVGTGTLYKLGIFLRESGFSKVIVYFGDNLISLFGSRVFKSLEDCGIEVLHYEELDSIHMEDIIKLAFSIPNNANAVIGIGGGKVIDTAKYVGYLRRIPFISIPTSSSSDGFSSSSASLLVEGKRNSVPAKLAYGIIIDLNVIKSAPEKFIYSGIGDLLSKITAIYDWQYENEKGKSDIDDFAVMIAKKAVNSFVRTPFKSIKDDLFLKELLDSLAMSGIANEMAGNSAPSSGSEHLISHALDKILETPELHGIQVGISTYIMSIIQRHRNIRINQVLSDTGFWNYAATLKMRKSDFEKAIDLAPSIKPNRHVFIHEERYREEAKKILYSDEILNKVLI